MRVTCLFVSVAIMLAGEIQSLPILGLGSLPVLGHEGRLVNSVTNIVTPLSLAGKVSGDLLKDSAHDDVISETGLAGDKGLINSKSTLGGVVVSLERRQDIALTNGLGNLLSGLTSAPLLGSATSVLPITKPITTKLGSLDGNVPALNNLGSPLHNVSPVNALTILKRGAETSALGSMPIIGSLPGASSLPLVKSVPSLSSLPLVNSVPNPSSLPLISSMPNLSTLPLISSVPAVSQLSSGFPASLGSLL